MWKQVRMCSYGIVALLFSAAAMMGNSSAQALLSDAQIRPDASSGYYIVTRPDPRLCPSPLCGGHFVKQINKPRTLCADLIWQQDCHAAELDASALGWSSDEFAIFYAQFGQSHALARGKLLQMDRGSIKADVLVLDEGWLGQALSEPIGAFYGAKGSGITCITYPCPSIRERTLNLRNERLIAEIDLAASGANAAQIEAGYSSLSEPAGILAAGEHRVISDPAGGGLKLVASEFYLPLVAKNPTEGQACGGIQGLACPQSQFCDINMPNVCGGADLSGICRVPPQACALIYAPVCGCDGITYGNDCERQAARMQLDHPGECQKP